MTARLMFGSERLRLGFTTNRIIVDRIGKRGSGAVIGTSLLGRIGEAVEDLFKGGRESLRKKKIEEMSPSQILRAHKDNFAIGYREVVNVVLEQTETLNKITILTVADKFEFTCTSRFAVIVETFNNRLSDKSVVQKLAR